MSPRARLPMIVATATILFLGGVAMALSSQANSRLHLPLVRGGPGAIPSVTPFATVTTSPPRTPQIAFSSYRHGNYELYSMDADGTNVTRITTNPHDDKNPVWSPDGSRLAYTAIPPGCAPYQTCLFDLFVINADGSGLVQLTNHPRWDGWPRWSPDGTRIAFVSGRDGNNEIYVITADGTGLTRLTDNPKDDIRPSWSPDGQRIAFQTNRDGDYEIYVMGADGSNPTRLTASALADEGPAWRP